jgi:hypothetical protein
MMGKRHSRVVNGYLTGLHWFLRSVGILLLCGWLMPLNAEENSHGVDAVLVIDSSGSMKQTDPRRLRVPAAKMFISLLSSSDRVGLISFSDDGYPIAHLTQADKQHQAELLASVEKVSAKGAYTNLHAALAKGYEMLKREGDSTRRRMLVLMSDGKMDTGDFEQDKALIEKIRSEMLATLVQEGIEVYTIAFTEASDMPLMEQISEQTAALSRMASNDRELHQVFSQIFESAKQPDMLPMDEGGFMVDTAVEEVTVVASKASADVEINLLMPDGRKIVATNAGNAVRWFKSEQFDMITVEKPPAGQWKLEYSDNRGDRAYVVTKLGVDARVGEAPIYVDAEQTSEAWLHDNGEVITKPEILGQTTFMLEIIQPDGKAAETPLADAGTTGDRAAADGVYSNLLAFAQPGQHQVRVIARNPNFQREKSIIVSVATPTVDTTQPPMPEPAPVVEAVPEPAVETPAEAPPVSEETIKDEPAPEEGMNVGLMVSLFVLVNIVIAAGVGGFLFWRKRKAAKAAAAATEADADEEK